MKNIGVFFGSRSPEHDISIITAEFIISGLKGLGHNVVPVYIARDGSWMIDEKLGELKTFINPKTPIEAETRYKQYFLDLEESKGKLVFKKKGLAGKSIVVDLAFPALHGSFGEDGTLQGLFEMFNVAYVGCDVTSSAISMDKAVVKQLCDASGIPTTKYVSFYNQDWQNNKEAVLDGIKKELSFPVFVKPVHLGSSIGISRVKSFADLEEKIELGLFYDDKVLVEEGVTDLMDVTCCLLGNDNPEASLLQESAFDTDFFDFEEKYLKEGGGTQFGKGENGLIIPARLGKVTTTQIQDTAKEVFKILGCSGIARVDFLYNKKTKKYYANEVNPLPGTLYHHLWKESGTDFPELLSRLLKLAEEKYEKKQKVSHTFKSSVLSSLESVKLGKKGGNQ